MQIDVIDDVPSLEGKVALVTGATAGLGFAITRHLANKGATVYIAARTDSRGADAKSRLESAGWQSGKIKILECDLSDPLKTKAAAEKFIATEARLDILIQSAAIINDHGKLHFDSNGLLETMTTNYLGPFILTHYLLPLLESTAATPGSDVRIINIGTKSHGDIPSSNKVRFNSKEALNNDFKSSLVPSYSRYAYSKLAFHLWSNRLLRKLDAKGSKIEVIILHPGAIYSEGSIAALKTLPLSTPILALARKFFIDPTTAALPAVFAAASPKIRSEKDKYHGCYMLPKMVIGQQKAIAMDEKKQEELWEFTENYLTGLGVLGEVAQTNSLSQ